MTKLDYMKFHKAACAKMIAITKAKNSDYTGASADPFSNFNQIGGLVQLPMVTEIGFLTRMSDKISRVGSFITRGTLTIKEESVTDTLIDLANYCILFAGYLAAKKKPIKKSKPKRRAKQKKLRVVKAPSKARSVASRK